MGSYSNSMTALLILFGLLNMADGYLTYQGIRFGAHEAWIPQFLFRITGVYWGLLISKVAVVAALWYWRPLPLEWMIAADIGYAILIAWNWRVLQKQKGKRDDR